MVTLDTTWTRRSLSHLWSTSSLTLMLLSLGAVVLACFSSVARCSNILWHNMVIESWVIALIGTMDRLGRQNAVDLCQCRICKVDMRLSMHHAGFTLNVPEAYRTKSESSSVPSIWFLMPLCTMHPAFSIPWFLGKRTWNRKQPKLDQEFVVTCRVELLTWTPSPSRLRKDAAVVPGRWDIPSHSNDYQFVR